MTNSIGPADYTAILKELQYSEDEDAKVNRQQADTFFNSRISEMRGQESKMREEAGKIGSMGWMNFGFSLFQAALSFAGPLFSKLSESAQKTMGFVTTGVQKVTDSVQQLLNQLNEQTRANLRAQGAEMGTRAEVDGKISTNASDDAAASRKRADESRQVLSQASRDNADAAESMIKM